MSMDIFKKLSRMFFFIMVFTLLPFIYYTYIPLDYIATTEYAYAENVSVDDTVQTIIFNRSIKHQHEALIVRELVLCYKGVDNVIYKKDVKILDRRAEGVIAVHYDIPPNTLEIGKHYFWQINIIRELPYGVKRYSVIKTNEFEVHP